MRFSTTTRNKAPITNAEESHGMVGNDKQKVDATVLDWKQTFDLLDHTAMMEALHRFVLSARIMSSIKSFYAVPTFETQGFNHTAVGKDSGIRQGCPLSPYLFITVLTAIFHDLDESLDQQGIARNTWTKGIPLMTLSMRRTPDALLCSSDHTADAVNSQRPGGDLCVI